MREIPNRAHLGGRTPEPEDRNLGSRMVARREVLEVPVVARHDERVRRTEPGDERAQQRIERPERIQRPFHRARVTRLVGLEELEDREIVAPREGAQDVGRLLRRAHRNVGAAGAGPAAGDVVGEPASGARVSPGAESSAARGVRDRRRRGAGAAAPDSNSGSPSTSMPSARR